MGIILQDFNEIDRYLVSTDEFFNYLGSFKALDTDGWSLDADPTDDYLNIGLLEKTGIYYRALKEVLTKNKVAYQV
jgi:hypothetical protein